MKIAALSIAVGITLSVPASAGDVSSVSRLAFGPENVLFVADWKSAQVHAVQLPPSTTKNDRPFNLLDISRPIRAAIRAESFRLEDLAVRPGTGEAYLALSYGTDRKPAILEVTADGDVKRLDLAAMKSSEAKLVDPPKGTLSFWNRSPERSFTVTAMKWRDGELYVSGLSNQNFASTLRRIRYPFGGGEATTSIEIYHTSHDQVETRAPIRTMTFVDFNGKPYLLAAYMCTPLVTIPLDDLKDGAHVTGKTIAELGYGNTPVDLVNFALTDKGKTTNYVLLTNVNRNGETVALDAIAAANAKPGMDKMVQWGQIEGVPVEQSPLSGVVHIDNYNDAFFLALRRDAVSGETQLVTISKQLKLRITDFLSEYDFPSYSYPQGLQADYIKPLENQFMNDEGFKDIVR
jgi:hypothetical protein